MSAAGTEPPPEMDEDDNPFVGPRAIEQGEAIHGRDKEIEELFYVFNAARIVLLHSPSGAGKSSLVQAGFLPRLRDRFDVWKPTRVNESPIPGCRNRYALSAIRGFDEGIPESLRQPPDELAQMTLAEYVAQRPRQRRAPESVALVIDQFEEVLTVDPLDLEVKLDFFKQLGALLRNPSIWALLVLREDYLAPLDDYHHEVPTHLRNRFRIDLLDRDAASLAIVRTAAKGDRVFESKAVTQLVNDLARVQVQQPDGTFRAEDGHQVEPVQLQVVCFRLWKHMPKTDRSIGPEDLDQYGDVNAALAGYYADAVGDVAGGDQGLERRIRDWFGGNLINNSVRNQVLRGGRSSEGLDNEIVDKLIREHHIVRSENRGGRTWYELAHDRLIQPVLSDNEHWNERHLKKFQIQARAWRDSGRPVGLVLTGEALREALAWAEENDAYDFELEFLQQGLEQQELLEAERQRAERDRELAERDRRQAEQDRQQAQRDLVQAEKLRRTTFWAKLAAWVATLAALLAVGFAIRTKTAERRAVEATEHAVKATEKATKLSEELKASGEAERRSREQAQLSAKTATEAAEKAERHRQRAEADEARAKQAEAAEKAANEAAQEDKRAADVARADAERDRDRAQQAGEEAEGARIKADAEAQQNERQRRLSRAGELAAKVRLMQRDEEIEAAARAAVGEYVWHVAHLLPGHPAAEPEPDIVAALHQTLRKLTQRTVVSGGPVRALLASHGDLVVVSPGRKVVTRREGTFDRLIWSRPEAATPLAVNIDGRVRSVAVARPDPDTVLVAMGDMEGWVSIQDVRKVGLPRAVPTRDGMVTALALSLDGKVLANGTVDGAITVRRTDQLPAASIVRRADPKDPDPVRAVALDAAGTLLCAGSRRGLECWRLVGLQHTSVHRGADALAEEVSAVAVDPDGDGRSLVLAGDAKGRVHLVDLRNGTARTLAGSDDEPHASRVNAVGFGEGARTVVSAGADGSVRFWPTASGAKAPPVVFKDHAGEVYTLARGADGEAFFSGGADGTVRKWSVNMNQMARAVCAALGGSASRDQVKTQMRPGPSGGDTCLAVDPSQPVPAR